MKYDVYTKDLIKSFESLEEAENFLLNYAKEQNFGEAKVEEIASTFKKYSFENSEEVFNVKKHIEVVAAIIIRDGKLFTTQRGYGEFKDGWEFPGGKMEKGETMWQALERELREELAIQVKATDLIKTVEYEYPNFRLTMHCLKTEIIHGEPNLLEHEDAKWVTKEQIDDVPWLPADLEVVENIKAIM